MEAGQPDRPLSLLLVSGVGPHAAETLAAAAVAAVLPGAVCVVKPAQCGPVGALAEITRRTRITDVHEFARFSTAVAPATAAAADGLPELRLADAVRQVVDLDATHDHVVIAGVGGLAVPFTRTDPWTVVDLAIAVRASVVLVAAPASLDHVALSVARLADDAVPLAGVVAVEPAGLEPLAPGRVVTLGDDLARASGPAEFARRARSLLSGLADPEAG